MINKIQISQNNYKPAAKKPCAAKDTSFTGSGAVNSLPSMSSAYYYQNVYKHLNDFMASLHKTNPNRLDIYYCNDMHGNSDQIAGVVEGAKEFKERSRGGENASFVLSAGDNYSGADTKKNDFMLNLMQNIMEVDVSAIGNHEIDAAKDGLLEIAKDKKMQFVATNVDFDDEHPMDDIVKKSIIKEENGVKYGFIGTMPIDFKTCTKDDVQKGVEVMGLEDTIEALQEEIDDLKKQGINRIILLSHIGYELDKQIAQKLDGVDIIIGGHSHSVVDGAQEGENLLKSKSGEPVIITQAGENGKYYGILNAEFDDNGVLKKVNNKLTDSPNKAKSPIIEQIKNQSLGVSPKVATIKKIDPMPANRRIEPSAWTCLMADSMKEELNSDIALINSANIRKIPQEGTLTMRDIQETAPMKNNLIKTKITQKQLVDAIQNAAKLTMSAEDGYPGLLQGSGFSYKIDDVGNLLEMNIVDRKGNKTPVDIKNPSCETTYSAIYDTFTSKADGETPELAPQFEVQEFDFDKDKTMIDYLSKLSNKENLEITDDHRIEIVKTSQSKPKGNNTRKFAN